VRYSNGFLEQLYQTMLRIRYCEESLVNPILDGRIKCPVHLYSGEEAIATGIGAALNKDDYIFGGHRSHGHYLAKGGDMNKLVAEIFTKVEGCSRGRGGSMHVIDPEVGMLGSAPIVGGTISLALGAALASSIRNDSRVTVSFFGDGATGEGVLHESLNFAALKKLPIIFACENNFYSTHLNIREIRVKEDIASLGIAFGIRNYKVDGNDVLKVYNVAKQSVDLCRSGGGPVLIEFVTYRLRGHVGPDDNIQGSHTDIRPKEELEKWLSKDPITRFEEKLNDKSLLPKEKIKEIKHKVELEVKSAIQFAEQSLEPKEGDITKYVFSE